ncbi:FG-GAP repeat domain-containing protein [Streptomyces oceani]|uniref:FG-GAP repeat domain-containing protein n=1 Tax=Streptomyces oceani TaxID=1075402 RepID=UPI001112D6E6|nr:VCBS repeat-containing protein [Streptomyces oceani]
MTPECEEQRGRSAERSRDTGKPLDPDSRDITGDGYQDLAVNEWTDAKGERWTHRRAVWNGGASSSDPPSGSRMPGTFPSLVDRQLTADVDGDGYADVLSRDSYVREPGDSRARDSRQGIQWGGPNGVEQSTRVPGSMGDLEAVGDFDGDGQADVLALSVHGSDESQGYERVREFATVHYGPLDRDGVAARTSKCEVSREGWVPVGGTTVGDFDGDGRDDLVVAGTYFEEDAMFEKPSAPAEVHSALYYEGGHDGLVGRGPLKGVSEDYTGTPAEQSPGSAGDFDGDGRDDLLVKQGTDLPTVLYHGSPGGLVTEREPVTLGDVDPEGTVGDIDGDGRDDLVSTVNTGATTVAVDVQLGTEDGMTSVNRSGWIEKDDLHRAGKAATSRDWVEIDTELVDLDGNGRAEVVIRQQGWEKRERYGGYWVLPDGSDPATRLDEARFVRVRELGHDG